MSRYFLIFLFSLFISGCATNNQAMSRRYVWPRPPDPTRIEWLATYSSQNDMEMTTMRMFKETIVGEDKPITMKRPVSAKYDSKRKKMYVADIDYPAVFVFNFKDNHFNTLTNDMKDISTKIIKPISVDTDLEGNIYILDAYTKSIIIYNYREEFERIISVSKQTDMPVSIAYNNLTKQIHLVDARANKIITLNHNGDFIFSFGKPGENSGEFNRPVGIAVASNGELIVADGFNARIQIFDPNGKFIRMFGRRGDADDAFQLIKGVAVDPDNNIYITDSRTNNVKIFNSNGTPLLVYGDYYYAKNTSNVPGGFAIPSSISINEEGIIAIADQLNSRVQVFKYYAEKPKNVK